MSNSRKKRPLDPVRSATFLGPANQRFDSFLDQSSYFLDTYCPKWKNFEKPESYILPPIFFYKNPEITDEVVEATRRELQEREPKSQIALVKHRISDDVEKIVFDSLFQLGQEKLQAPFMAIHNLDIYKMRHRIDLVFPGKNYESLEKPFQEGFREYDFLLIGPKIGLIVIEVKNSSFTQPKHFAPNSRYLPDLYHWGVKQLDSVEVFLKLLDECMGTKKENQLKIRKVLFTPCLARQRYDNWTGQLDEIAINQVREKTANITQWFQEDLTQSSEKPALYEKLKELFEEADFGCGESYKAFAPVMAGLASVAIIPKVKDEFLNLDVQKYSGGDALKREISRIERQDPSEELGRFLDSSVGIQWPTAFPNAVLDKMCQFNSMTSLEGQSIEIVHKNGSECGSPASKRAKFGYEMGGFGMEPYKSGAGSDVGPVISTIPKSKSTPRIVLLTPDQQSALNGPNRQFIFGAAGTGKTIILQQKAMQLLDLDRSILIICAQSYLDRYEHLISEHPSKKCQVLSLCDIRRNFIDLVKNCGHFGTVNLEDEKSLLLSIDQYMRNGGISDAWFQHCISWVFHFDNILIDDSFDYQESNLRDWRIGNVALFVAMKVEEIWPRDQLLWIGIDPYLGFTRYDNGNHRSELFADLVSNGMGFHVAKLNHVMRCSENVHQVAYKNWTEKPILGHKVQGQPTFLIKEICQKSDQTMSTIFEKVKEMLIRVIELGIEKQQMAIIVQDNEFIGDYLKSELTRMLEKDPNMFASETWNFKGGTLLIRGWDEVSSLEWPVVIHVLVRKYGDSDRLDEDAYRSYRACSRAMVKLIQISVECQHEELSGVFDLGETSGNHRSISLNEDRRITDRLISEKSVESKQALYSGESSGTDQSIGFVPDTSGSTALEESDEDFDLNMPQALKRPLDFTLKNPPEQASPIHDEMLSESATVPEVLLRRRASDLGETPFDRGSFRRSE